MASEETVAKTGDMLRAYATVSRFEYNAWFSDKLFKGTMLKAVFRAQLELMKKEGVFFGSILFCAMANDDYGYSTMNILVSVLDLLFDYGFEVKVATDEEIKAILVARNRKGMNILHDAIFSDRIDQVKILLDTPKRREIFLDKQSSENYCTLNGELLFPEDLAAQLGYHDIAEFIRKCQEMQRKNSNADCILSIMVCFELCFIIYILYRLGSLFIFLLLLLLS